MLDSRFRAMLGPALDAAGRRLAAAGVPPVALTGAGWAAGAGACAATALRAWPVALGLWLANRLADGLAGPVARASGSPSEAGGFLDIVADLSVYAGVILGLAVGVPAARLACVALLTAYYVSGTAFLALSSLGERRRQRQDRPKGPAPRNPPFGDERSLRFVGGLAEGTETIVIYVLLFVLPQHAVVIVWGFTAAVAVTAAQRIVVGVRLLGAPSPADLAGTATGTGTPQHAGREPLAPGSMPHDAGRGD
jgi:phosphatidylglycerophosphate synthase